VDIHVTAVCGLLTAFFVDRPVVSYGDAVASDVDAFRRFFNEMLDRGVYLPPSPFEAWFPSLAHDDEVIDRTIELAGQAFGAIGES
jgi:glutamate-1-semialdehyde 2,1-aminomutase